MKDEKTRKGNRKKEGEGGIKEGMKRMKEVMK